LLLSHPDVQLSQVTSQRNAGNFIHSLHPNLRKKTSLQFVPVEQLVDCDVLFLCLPHGSAANQIGQFAAKAEWLIDCSADFRLRDPSLYREWYGWEHPNPDWLTRFVYGLPELYREQIAKAKYVSGVGCNATATNIALLPLARSQLIRRAIVDVKVGSSEGGNQFSLSTHHPERAGAVRSFAATGHRHQAEVVQALGDFELHFSATAVELVRGVLCTAHVFCSESLTEKDLWRMYRAAYNAEPFVRIAKDKKGIYRLPEPKILAGTNFADVGFEVDERTGRVVVISAIDNLMKGAAGSAVQCMNLMLGIEETRGLEFCGLHPI
jgi:N-acetyl-gamma-glutamyl-phosphate/LysW-gamma-L-alpha-aminoadipyl-6-phosphate reductase